jgi:uncharacterized protein (UPF0264 family)
MKGKLFVPKLLVSVRSVAEAVAAMAGGANVIDIKDPSQGSLGMADVGTIVDIAECVRSTSGNQSIVPVTAALGETTDWLDGAIVPSLCAELDYVKLGSSGLASVGNWSSAWLNVRQQFEAAANHKLRWIAVSYVDWRTCNGPSPAEIIEAAALAGSAGVLFDTFDKQSGRLFDHITQSELHALCRTCRERNLLTAVAGRLTTEALPLLADSTADVVAVRSAVCDASDRRSTVREDAVSRFQTALGNAFGQKPFVDAVNASR